MLSYLLQSVSSYFKEGKPRTEVIQNDGRRRRSFMQFLNERRMKTCFCLLDIRQGTILLALLELIMLTVVALMVIMVLLHVMQIEALIISEVEDSPARESIALSGLTGQEAIIAEVNNESRLQVGLHLAAYKMIGLVVVMMFVLLHIVSSILLLMGALTRRRGMLIMWLCTAITDMSGLICSAILAVSELILKSKRYVSFGVGAKCFLLLSFISIAWLTHNILIVVSLYIQLFEEKKYVKRIKADPNFHIRVAPNWYGKYLDRDVVAKMLGKLSANDDDDVRRVDKEEEEELDAKQANDEHDPTNLENKRISRVDVLSI